jgi:molecular chaperone GrpE (heat shock protein)
VILLGLGTFRGIHTNKTYGNINKNQELTLVSSLCREIDTWQDTAMYWKEKYEQLLKEQNEESQERLKTAQKGIANALLFALSVKDDADGNLVITKEDRKTLGESWKS